MNKIVDIHSHIIPNVDDGAKNIELTLEMIQKSIENEVLAIVATPHYRAKICKLTYKEIEEKVKELNERLKRIESKVQIYPGQEIYYTDELLDDLKNGSVGTINNSRYILIELSSTRFEEQFLGMVYELKLRGIVPIIAHPERYLYIQKDDRYINKLIDEGCLFQLDAGSLEGLYGKDAKYTAVKIIKNNIYNFIGSDSHDIDGRGNYIKSCLSKIKKINKEFIDNVKLDSGNLLLDKDIEFRGEKIKRRNLISSFLERKSK